VKKLTLHYSTGNYSKAFDRLQKNILSGRFASYTQQKKQQIWKRLCRYARQLGIKIKAPIAAACIAAGLTLSNSADAQTTFAVQSGASNPLNGVNAGNYSKPVFVDIDGDGDKDVFIGIWGSIAYYKNTGTASVPVFTLQSGALNPFNGSGFGEASPAFGDIDGDGDKDAFIGTGNSVAYYKNTGTASAPVFTVQSGVSNPFNGVSILNGWVAPALVDIDGDGDLDAFIGGWDGTMKYYKNTGTASAPVFTLQSGVSNPLNGVDVGYLSTPGFVDIDKDGDMDVLIGEYYGSVSYYKNTGTSSAAIFTVQSGVLNPFNGVDIGFISAPSMVDINNDNLADVFIGDENGNTSFYKNTTTILPLNLLDFSGNSYPGYNQLQWKTADEVNTQQFDVESSYDGNTFTKIATVNAEGSGNNEYSYADKKTYSGKVFYRLKMIDIDDKFTYSHVIWLNNEQSGGGTIIYPNPAKDVINISTGSEGLLKTTAGLYNTDGRLMQNILINNRQQQINVQSLPTGIYTIKFADGTVRRFIKE